MKSIENKQIIKLNNTHITKEERRGRREGGGGKREKWGKEGGSQDVCGKKALGGERTVRVEERVVVNKGTW